jgi:dTDP-glucose pyrophosphorylase
VSATGVTKAVILARGLGTRMRQADASAQLDREQLRVAETGLKAMLPLGGRLFLDYVLSGLADAGFREICLVVGPEHTELRKHYQQLTLERIRIHFAIQERAMGTADAVLAAESFVGGDFFLVLNSDNYYPIETYRQLGAAGEPALAAFERAALIRESNIDEERIRRYSVVETDAAGYLQRILEKPDEATLAAHGSHALIGMNCWMFRPAILAACRKVRPSVRGELELPEAVQLAVDTLRERIRVIGFSAGVVDLSYRADVVSAEKRLAGIPVRL